MVDLAAPAVQMLKIFNRVAAGSLAILLSSCASLKAPKTLFITLGSGEDDFKAEKTQIQSLINTYRDFQRSNPGVNVYINYKSKNVLSQIAKTAVLILAQTWSSPIRPRHELLLAASCDTAQSTNLDSIISQRIQSVPKETANICLHHG